MDLLCRLNDYLKNMGIDYAVCGGSAIDLFLGRKTRPHKDLDVAVYWEDRENIVSHMLKAGWDVYEPCGCEHLHKINRVDDQKRLKSNIWCVRPENPHYRFEEHENDMYGVVFDNSEQTELDFIEFLFNSRNEAAFLYAKDHEIKRDLDFAVQNNRNIPYLAPEVVLLYKSNALSNPDYRMDFNNAFPAMYQEQKEWLLDALKRTYPNGHPWIEFLNQNSLPVFYHGSTEKLTMLNAFSKDHSDAESSVVYLTPNRAYALFYIRDREINWVTCGVKDDGVIRYDERFPDQLKTIYQGVSGYIYTCEDNGSFIASKTRDIYTCNQPIIITGKEFVPDVYDEILKYEKSGLVNVRRYETLLEEEKQDVFDMMVHSIFKNDLLNSSGKKAAFYREHFPEAWEYVKTHPEHRQDILDAWRRRLRS